LRNPLLPPFFALAGGVVAARFVSFGLTELGLGMVALAVLAALARWKSTRRVALAALLASFFFTGALIARFGLRTIMATGLALIVAAATVGFLGIALWNFWVSLGLLGIGWNFGFISATTLLTECHGPRERNKVQAFNDFLIFGSMALASFSSGALLSRFGWIAINELVYPVVIAAALLLAWGTFARRPNPV